MSNSPPSGLQKQQPLTNRHTASIAEKQGNENTLIKENPKGLRKQPSLPLLPIILVLLVLSTLLYSNQRARSVLKYDQDKLQYTSAASDFQPRLALSHLRNITSLGPRPLNSRANLRVATYIWNQINKTFSDASNSLGLPQIDVAWDNGTWDGTKCFVDPMYGRSGLLTHVHVEKGSNILARITGKCEETAKHELYFGATSKCPVLLISSHYDSVIGTVGATDDGIAVACMLEAIHALGSKENSVYPTIIFLFNNGEEMHLLGSSVFVGHPWFREVDAFINLEGAGSMGRPMLFRGTNYRLLDSFRKVPFPHASVIGNDVFKLGLVKSSTDYSVYLKAGIPGLDIAFYKNRYIYHTIKDRIYPRITMASIQQMGSNLLASITALSEENLYHQKSGLNNETKQTFFDVDSAPAVYWDDYGNFRIFSFEIFGGMQLLMAAVIFLHLAYNLWSRMIQTAFVMKLLLIIAGIVSSSLLVFVSARIVDAFSPLAFYGYPMLWIGHIAFCSLIGILLPQLCMEHGLDIVDEYHDSSDVVAAFWGMASLLTAFAGRYQIGMFYCIPVFWGGGWVWSFHIRRTFLNRARRYNFHLHAIPSEVPIRLNNHVRPRYFYPIIDMLMIIFRVMFPLHFTYSFLYATIDAMAPTLIDGMSSALLSVLISLYIILPIIASLPWIKITRQIPRFLQYLAAIDALVIVLLCLSRRPFSATQPLKIMFQQRWDLTNNVIDSFIQHHKFYGSNSVRSLAGVPMKFHECIPMKTLPKYFQICRIANSPGFVNVRPPTLPSEPVVVKLIPTKALDSEEILEVVSFSVIAKETHVCWVRWPFGEALEDEAGGHIPANLFSVTSMSEGIGHSENSLPRFTYVRNDSLVDPIVFSIRYNSTAFKKYQVEKSFGVLNPALVEIGCNYDDIEAHVPAWGQFTEGLPSWALLHASGSGAVKAFHSVSLPLS